jgi:magnesium transporter
MKYFQEVAQNGLVWINVSRQHEKELSELGKRFGFNKADLAEALPPLQRPKIVKRGHYYFIILHFPVFNRENKRLGFTEVDIFLSPTFLVTLHDGSLPAVELFFADCKKNVDIRQRFFEGTSAHLFLEVWFRLCEAIFPSLLHISADINSVDKTLFGHAGEDRRVAKEILRLKTNIVTFRRTMQGHRTVLDRLVIYGGHDLRIVNYQAYITSLRENTTEIWHMLESQKESINALHETNESILSLRTTDVMKTLTIISVLTFPLTLLATILAIRAPGTPFVDHPWGFVIIMSAAVLGAATMLFAFKRKRWM